jgi:hypothetical protein
MGNRITRHPGVVRCNFLLRVFWSGSRLQINRPTAPTRLRSALIMPLGGLQSLRPVGPPRARPEAAIESQNRIAFCCCAES